MHFTHLVGQLVRPPQPMATRSGVGKFKTFCIDRRSTRRIEILGEKSRTTNWARHPGRCIMQHTPQLYSAQSEHIRATAGNRVLCVVQIAVS